MFYALLFFFFPQFSSEKKEIEKPIIKKPFVVMLDPAQNKQHMRAIDGTYEHGITLPLAHALKKRLTDLSPFIEVIINQTETNDELQTAQYANRLNVDFFLHLAAFEQKEKKPSSWLYYFSYADPIPMHDPLWYSVERAYLINTKKTASWATIFNKHLKEKMDGDHYGPYAIPVKPLFGIVPHSFYLEIGLEKQSQWKSFVEPLTSIITLFAEIQKQ